MYILVIVIIVLLAGEDYDPDPVDAVFAAGQTSTTIEIPIRMDNKAEDNEEFGLTIVIPSEVERLVSPGARNSAVGVIQDSSGTYTQPYWYLVCFNIL